MPKKKSFEIYKNDLDGDSRINAFPYLEKKNLEALN